MDRFNLDFNLKNTPKPKFIDAKTEIKKAIKQFYKKTIKGFYDKHAFMKNKYPNRINQIVNKYFPTVNKHKTKWFHHKQTLKPQREDTRPIAWDLFSGSGSVTRVLRKMGFKVISVEINKRLARRTGAIAKDVTKMDFTKLPKPVLVWTNPPCIGWSNATKKSDRNNKYKGMQNLSLWCINFIKKIKPKFWCLENPASTKLHKQDYMEEFKKYITECSYCQYDRPYRKNTTIWNNFDLKLNTCKCIGKHKVKLGGNYGGTPGCRRWAKRKHKISVPEKLIETIVKQLQSKTKIYKPRCVHVNNTTLDTKTKTSKEKSSNNDLITDDVNHASQYIPSEKSIREFKRDIHKCAIVTYLDKNAGAGILMCKKHHYEITKKSFCDDPDHYEKTGLTTTEVMGKFEDFHKKNNLNKIKVFHGKTRSIPYSYCLPKSKDITRIRPIVSYYKHPLKESYNYASRALTQIIKQTETRHFTLWKTQDLKPKIKLIQSELGKLYGDNTKFKTMCADIKNMYTELPHDEILKSIKFMLNKAKKTTRRKFITIEKRKRGEIHLGKTSAVTSDTHTALFFR